MSYFRTFTPSGDSLKEDCPAPHLVDAAFGRVAEEFVLLEDAVEGTLTDLLMIAKLAIPPDLVAMSFRRKVQMCDSVLRLGHDRGLIDVGEPSDPAAYFDELTAVCLKCDDLWRAAQRKHFGVAVREWSTLPSKPTVRGAEHVSSDEGDRAAAEFLELCEYMDYITSEFYEIEASFRVHGDPSLLAHRSAVRSGALSHSSLLAN